MIIQKIELFCGAYILVPRKISEEHMLLGLSFRPSVLPSVRPSTLYFITASQNFLKLCMKLRYPVGSRLTFPDFWRKFSFVPQGVQRCRNRPKIGKNGPKWHLFQHISRLASQNFLKISQKMQPMVAHYIYIVCTPAKLLFCSQGPKYTLFGPKWAKVPKNWGFWIISL